MGAGKGPMVGARKEHWRPHYPFVPSLRSVPHSPPLTTFALARSMLASLTLHSLTGSALTSFGLQAVVVPGGYVESGRKVPSLRSLTHSYPPLTPLTYARYVHYGRIFWFFIGNYLEKLLKLCSLVYLSSQTLQ